MEKYKYVDPVENGYKQFKLTKKQHNELFKYRKITWADKYDYYDNGNHILIHKFINWKGVLYCTLTVPVAVLLNGVVNFKEILKELKELYNQKESGSFSSDIVQGDRYEKLMKMINENKRGDSH